MALWLALPVRLARLVAFIALMSVMTSARPTTGLVSRGLPKPPSEDPFYQPPAGLESEAAGAILRQRNITAAFFGLIPDPVEAYQLLYRTTAINGSAIATVTTIFKPLSAKTDRFVSFQTAYDSSATKCDPSYNYQLGSSQNDLISSFEMYIIQAYLLSGYIVASPDYEGPDAAFSPGHLEGMGVLDGMRAVANFQDALGLSSPKPMIVGTGYSGGAIATGWAASLQPSYAPELRIKGWTHGGTPANLTGTLLYINDTPFSGFIPGAVAGLVQPSAYGALLRPLMDRILTAKGRSELDYAESHCAVADLLKFPDQSLFSKSIQTLGPSILQNPSVSYALLENIMGVYKNETPTAPLFVYHALQDEIIPYSNASTLVDSWCDNGASVKFTTYRNGGHATTEAIALPDVLNFVQAAFGGTTASGCSRDSQLNSFLDPLALGVEIEPVLTKLIEGLTIAGEKDANIINNIQVLEETF